MFEAGETLGPYTIVRRLGAGAMGEVYQGRHRHMGRDAAIKVLRAELTEDSEVVSRFFTEARATAAVHHPAIVQIFDCDVDRGGRAFIVMEFLVGEDLAQRLSPGRSFAGQWHVLRAIGRQVAGGLGAAHAAGIVHRDLKPANIFLVGAPAEPAVKIVDFGIAKLLQREGAAHAQTQTGHILGTPLYMSPEQARGAKAIDHRTDVYALGCVLFEMITGKPPFVRRGAAEVIVAHLNEKAPRASSLEPSVPPALDELVAQMLAKDPESRPQSMTDVAARLAEPAAGHVATMLLPSAGSEPVAAPQKSATPAPGVPVPVARAAEASETRLFERAASTTLRSSAAEVAAATDVVSRSARRPPWAAIGAAAVVVIAAVGFVVLRAGGRASAPEPVVAAAPAAAPATTLPAAPVLRRISFTSEPAGAEVWIDDEAAARGRTPLTIELAAGTPARAVLRLPAHEPVSLAIDGQDAGARHVVLPASAAPPPAPEAAPAEAAPAPRAHHRHAKGSGEFKAIED
jgi:serine/threonine-protein kinase